MSPCTQTWTAVNCNGSDSNMSKEEKSSTLLPDSTPPIECPSLDSLDALINSEMCRLSIGERDKALHDVHGVSDDIEESPKFILEHQNLLDDELSKLRDKRSAYDLAHKMNPKYVENPEFRLRFLRTESFDAKQAAIRIAAHFESKLELFGESKLPRDIVQDDLEKEDLEILNCGAQQILPVRDRAGRTIALWIPKLLPRTFPLRNKLRRLFYAMMVDFKDSETQKKGMVLICYLNGSKTKNKSERATFWRYAKIAQALFPIKVVVVHICYESAACRPLISLGTFVCESYKRCRLRRHCGTHTECVHSLQTFGIPAYALPFDENGEPNADHNVKYWEKRRRHERMTHKVERVVVPGPYDVLLGRGRLCQEHLGNVRYRFLIAQHMEWHNQASRDLKPIIAVSIVQKVKEYAGRFLKDDGAGWVIASERVARAKAAHSFRDLRSSVATTPLLKEESKEKISRAFGDTAANIFTRGSPVGVISMDRGTGIDNIRAKRQRSCEI